jgi:hypothetical protein
MYFPQGQHSRLTSAPLALAIAAGMLFASLAIMSVPQASAETPNLWVSAQAQTGTALTASGASTILVTSQYSPLGNLTGVYVALSSNGRPVASGVTPAVFSTNSGQSYAVTVSSTDRYYRVSDYANTNYYHPASGYTHAYFYQWSTGEKNRTIDVTASSSQTALDAIYCETVDGCGTPSGPAASSISVTSQYSGGTALTGIQAVIQQGGQTIGSGPTPVAFSTTNGLSYSVTVSDYTGAYFSSWSSGITSRTIIVSATSSQTSLVAIFCQTQGCSSGAGGGGGGGGGASANTITVTGSDLASGAKLLGMYVDLRLDNNHIMDGYTPVTFTGLQTGTKYLVVVYGYGDSYFRHFSSGDLQRYSYVTLNATAAGQTSYTLNALFETVPSSQAASLNLIAQFPNGTQIGTASEISGYPQHTPGMYLSVTPPGATAPYTATFTGGSILPFTFFNGRTYTVAMSAGYGSIHFDHWKDNGSTNPTRAFALSGNSSYVAVYVKR